MALKILIIDDNETYAKQLKIHLKNSGHNFDPHYELTCQSGKDYFEKHMHEVCAILLDVNFDEKEEGLILLKEINKICNVWVGLISQSFETKKSPEQLGCDAIFYKQDVKALTNALSAIRLGNMIPKSNHTCKLELINNHFFCNNKLIPLSGKEFKLLEYLYNRKKDDPVLNWRISEETGISTNSVKTQVSNIRKKLPDYCSKKIIVSVESRGYYCPFPKNTEE